MKTLLQYITEDASDKASIKVVANIPVSISRRDVNNNDESHEATAIYKNKFNEATAAKLIAKNITKLATSGPRYIGLTNMLDHVDVLFKNYTDYNLDNPNVENIEIVFNRKDVSYHKEVKLWVGVEYLPNGIKFDASAVGFSDEDFADYVYIEEELNSLKICNEKNLASVVTDFIKITYDSIQRWEANI